MKHDGDIIHIIGIDKQIDRTYLGPALALQNY